MDMNERNEYEPYENKSGSIMQRIFLALAVLSGGILGHSFVNEYMPDFFDDNDDDSEAYYSEGSHESTSEKLQYYTVQGMTAEEFNEQWSDEYILMHWATEYNKNIPEGHIIRVEDAWNFFQGQYDKHVLNAYYSAGKAPENAVCDFRVAELPHNYYEQSGDPNLISHNVFYLKDGQTSQVDIRLDDDYSPENGKWQGKMDKHIVNELGGGVIAPCAYDSGVGSALRYEYTEHFSLKLDDYDGDGNPDYCLRVGEPKAYGAYYVMQCMNATGRANSANISSSSQISDSSFFVYGQTEDSIKLRRINRDAFFFLTGDTSDDVKPMIFTGNYGRISTAYDRYSIDNMLLFSDYEDGKIILGFTDVNGKRRTLNADAVLKRLDKLVWKNTGTAFSDIAIESDRYGSGTAEFDMPLEKGVYRLIVSGQWGEAATEFTVR